MAAAASSIEADAEDVRLQVYRSFVETGGAPADEQLATRLGLGIDHVRACLAAAAEYFRSVGLAGPFWGL